MAKVYNYMVIWSGVIILLAMAGIYTGFSGSTWFGIDQSNPGQFSLSEIFNAVFNIFLVGAGTGIAISFITKSPSETWVVATLCGGITTNIVGAIISVVNYSKDFGYVYYILFAIMMPLALGFLAAIISFWRGSDG